MHKVALTSFATLALAANLFAQTPQGPELPGTPEPERPYLTGDWAKMRAEGSAFSLELSYTQEYLAVVSGGISRNGEYNALALIDLHLDLEKLFAWQGASFHATGLAPIGSSVSGKYVGDDSNVSNINFRNSARIFEIWLEQNLFDGKLSIRLGQLASDSEFFGSEIGEVDGGGLFINGDFGAMPISGFNAPFPNYAIATPGVRVRVNPTDSTYFQVAVYDGNPSPDVLGDPTPGFRGGDEYNDYGVHVNLNHGEGVLVLGEAGFTINQQKEPEATPSDITKDGKAAKSIQQVETASHHGLPGSYKIGGYYHSDDFTKWSDGSAVEGTFAGYVIAAQKVMHENDNDSQGLYLFGRGSIAPEDRAVLDWAFDGGINYVGLIPGRDEDNFGVGYTYKHYSNKLSDSLVAGGDESLDAEAILEVTYKANITPWLTVQPDLQYVFNPGGRSSSADALVVGLRITTLF